MFPDHTLTDQDIKDLLAYFSLLRRHAPVPENALTDCPATNLISRHAFFSGLAPVCQREKICGSTDTFLITLRPFFDSPAFVHFRTAHRINHLRARIVRNRRFDRAL